MMGEAHCRELLYRTPAGGDFDRRRHGLATAIAAARTAQALGAGGNGHRCARHGASRAVAWLLQAGFPLPA